MTALQGSDNGAGNGTRPGRPTALIMDYGGVLTPPLADSFAQLGDAVGVSGELFLKALKSTYAAGDDRGTVGRLERGEIELEEFETEFDVSLREHGGALTPGSMVTALSAAFRADSPLWGVTAHARAAGVQTALLSNSWGTSMYPHDELASTFDAIVISGQVGLRKPSREIFDLTIARLGVAAEACVFVDDFAVNVDAATALGMRGVLHVDPNQTIQELSALFELDFTEASQ